METRRPRGPGLWRCRQYGGAARARCRRECAVRGPRL